MTLREFWTEVRKDIPDINDRYVTVIGKRHGEMMENTPPSDDDNATDITSRGEFPLFESNRMIDALILEGFEMEEGEEIVFPFNERQARLSDHWTLRIVHGPIKIFGKKGSEEFRCVHGKREGVKR